MSAVRHLFYYCVKSFGKQSYKKCTWLKKREFAPIFRLLSGAAKPLTYKYILILPALTSLDQKTPFVFSKTGSSNSGIF